MSFVLVKVGRRLRRCPATIATSYRFWAIRCFGMISEFFSREGWSAQSICDKQLMINCQQCNRCFLKKSSFFIKWLDAQRSLWPCCPINNWEIQSDRRFGEQRWNLHLWSIWDPPSGRIWYCDKYKYQIDSIFDPEMCFTPKGGEGEHN